MWPERPNYEAPVELNPGRRYEHGLCIVFREVFAWKVQIGSLKISEKRRHNMQKCRIFLQKHDEKRIFHTGFHGFGQYNPNPLVRAV